jgi:hypothetical protein
MARRMHDTDSKASCTATSSARLCSMPSLATLAHQRIVTAWPDFVLHVSCGKWQIKIFTSVLVCVWACRRPLTWASARLPAQHMWCLGAL